MANRTPLLAGALGLATGLVGAFVGAHLATRAAPVRPPSAASGTRAPVVPPGWDPRVADQVAALEGRLSEAERTLRAAGTTAAAPAVPEPAPVGPGGRGPAREGQRLEHYQAELATFAGLLAGHETEPVDASWSTPTAESIQSALSAEEGAERSYEVKAVDCRSATCVATLAFRSPAEGLTFLARRGGRLGSRQCNGYTVTPQPPTGDGAYDLQVIYTCR